MIVRNFYFEWKKSFGQKFLSFSAPGRCYLDCLSWWLNLLSGFGGSDRFTHISNLDLKYVGDWARFSCYLIYFNSSKLHYRRCITMSPSTSQNIFGQMGTGQHHRNIGPLNNGLPGFITTGLFEVCPISCHFSHPMPVKTENERFQRFFTGCRKGGQWHEMV